MRNRCNTPNNSDGVRLPSCSCSSSTRAGMPVKDFAAICPLDVQPIELKSAPSASEPSGGQQTPPAWAHAWISTRKVGRLGLAQQRPTMSACWAVSGGRQPAPATGMLVLASLRNHLSPWFRISSSRLTGQRREAASSSSIFTVDGGVDAVVSAASREVSAECLAREVGNVPSNRRPDRRHWRCHAPPPPGVRRRRRW